MECEKSISRVEYMDFIKGVLIALVIFGHVTAELSGGANVVEFTLFSGLTVSFIMPLFIMTSGYFSYSEKKTRFLDFVRKQFDRLIIPAVLWGGGLCLIKICIKFLTGDISIFSSKSAFLFYVFNGVAVLWFLYSIFICKILLYLTNRYFTTFKKRLLIYILTGILFFFIPTDKWYVGFAYPFFWIGSLYRQYEYKINLHKRILVITCMIAFLVMLPFYTFDYSVYEAGINIFTNANGIANQILINSWRFMVGLAGSISMGYLMFKCYKIFGKNNPIIAYFIRLGRISLELYVTQFIVVEFIFLNSMKVLTVIGLNFTLTSPLIRYFIWRHVFGFILIEVCCYAIRYLKNIPLLYGRKFVGKAQCNQFTKSIGAD